jgi:hypothetical protein
MKKYFKIITLATLVVSLGSCLKDKNYDNGLTGLDLSNAPKVIELAVANSLSTSKKLDLLFLNELVDVAIVTVRLASKDPATENITVLLDTIGTEAKIIAEGDSNFNRQPSLFTMPATGLTVTIPKGAREASLTVKTNASKFDPASVYGINFKLKAVNNPGYVLSGNFNEFYTTVGAKNAYQATYNVVSGGRYNFNGVSSVSYVYPQDPTLIAGYTNFNATGPTKDVVTVDADRCSIGIVNLGGGTFQYRYIVTIPPGSTGIVDLKPTMQYSPTFLAQTSQRDLQHATYNHSTKTFKFGLIYNNNGGSFRIHDEVLTRQ